MWWFAACGSPPPVPEVAAPEVVARYQCDRCHDAGPVFAAAVPERSCVRCHQQILRGELDLRYLPADTARWKSHLHRLVETPSLAGLSARRTRSAFVAFLQDPVDRRPHLPASMPRLALPPADAEALADVFGLVDPPASAPPSGDVERGLALITERCTPCHTSLPLAPDLGQVRDFSWPDAVDRWLLGPSLVVPGTAMPDPQLAPGDRRDVVAALFSGRLAPLPRPGVPARVPPPERTVTFAEVDEAVFHEVCRHCHADPAPVGGDGGPGNTGGFGYPGAGLDLSSEAAIRRGGRHDVLAPMPDGTPRLVAHLWARHAEVAGTPVEGVLGMPLGLPPLPPESIALVEAWIRQRP
jgi:cytochrome c5